MARYRVVFWKEIPSLVEAIEGDRTVRVPLSQRFQDLIDSVAMLTGSSSTEAYLEGWRHAPEEERPGSAESVAEQVVSELEAGFEQLLHQHLRNLVPRPQ